MSKPPPRGLIAKITITTPGTLRGAETPGAEERRLRARIAEARRDGDRDEHDFHVEALTALSLAQAWRDEQARTPTRTAAARGGRGPSGEVRADGPAGGEWPVTTPARAPRRRATSTAPGGATP